MKIKDFREMLRHVASILTIAVVGMLGTSATYGQSGSTVAVMTYNIRLNTASDREDAWPNRAAKVLETIKQSDTAGLQEVLKNQLDDLIAGLPEYDYVGAGRDDGKERGEFVPIFFRRDRFEKVNSGHFWLSETPDIPGSKSWDAAITRMVSWVELKEKSSGRSFLHLNTHFDHMGQAARFESAKLIRRKASQMSPELPLILTGDFNCNPSSEPYQQLTAEAIDGLQLRDSLENYVAKDGAPIGTWNAFKAIEENRIDFIFTSRKATSTASKILDPRTDAGRFASDHFTGRRYCPVPLTSRLALQQSNHRSA